MLAPQRNLVEKETYYSQLAACIMIRNKISKSIKIVGEPWTRHDRRVRNIIIKNTNEKRIKKIKKNYRDAECKFSKDFNSIKISVPMS